jgi:hypothetical protein
VSGATVLEARLVRKIRLERAAAVQDRAGQTGARIPTCKELRAQRARAAPARPAAVVLEAEAREHEVQALPAEAADRVAVAWGVPEAVAAAAVEVVAEQGNKSGLYWPGPLRSNSSQNLCELLISLCKAEGQPREHMLNDENNLITREIWLQVKSGVVRTVVRARKENEQTLVQRLTTPHRRDKLMSLSSRTLSAGSASTLAPAELQ